MKVIYYLVAVSLLFAACKSNTSENNDSDTAQATAEIVKVEAVCISNGVPVRAEPQKDGKYISSLNLGENLLYLGATAIDSADKNREYYSVELSDGTVAWARSYGVLIEATPAAIVIETPIFKRPDLVTKTDKKFSPMEFIAVVGEKAEWIEVVGAGKTKKGWIKKESITTQQEDVATSTMASKDLIKDGEIVIDKIATFLEELPYENTQFIIYLQSILDEQVGAAVEDVIEAYESAEDEIYD